MLAYWYSALELKGIVAALAFSEEFVSGSFVTWNSH
jgi:hypothetical protein